MTDIFLSYSSKDRERVRPLRDALVAAGYSVFWDQETPAGVNWNRWIMDRLSEARLVIVAWSKVSVASDPVIHEASIAREDGKLVPCMLENLSTRELPMGFYTAQAAILHDWTGQAAHKGFLDLMRAVHAKLKAGSGGVAAPEPVATPSPDRRVEIADLRRRAHAGEAWAQFWLGNLYFDGDGVLQNDLESVRFYKLAADQGDAGAQLNLGFMYQNGRGVAQDDGEAVRLYKLAADQGDAIAQHNLGIMYENGWGVAQDYGEALRLYKLAADQGAAEGQAALGVMYLNGKGVTQDDEEAVRLYKLAADQGNASAQVSLGVMYENGRGVAKDEREAARLYKLAADQGNAYAQAYLAEFYENEKGGLTRNMDEARRLYWLAAAQGSEYAKKALKRLGE